MPKKKSKKKRETPRVTEWLKRGTVSGGADLPPVGKPKLSVR